MGLRRGVTSGQEAMEKRVDEELSRLITGITSETDWLMREQGITRADLAGRMGVSPGRVSQILSGGENLTLRTLAVLAAALGARFEVELKPLDAERTPRLPATDGGDAVSRPAGPVAARADDYRQLPSAEHFEEAGISEFSRRR